MIFLKNKNIILTICILAAISLAVIGCSPAQRPQPPTAPAPNQQGIDRNRVTNENNIPRTDVGQPQDNGMLTDNNRPIVDNRMMDNRTMDNRTGMDNRTTTDNMSGRTSRIIREVENIRDVRNATVVITDRTALVGVDLTSGTKGELNREIKREIEDAVKRADRDITKVSVSADPDIFKRIDNIARDIGTGRPLSGFGREIEEIIRRITPGA